MASGKQFVHGDQKLLKRLATLRKGLPPLVSKERLGAFLIRRMQARFEQRVDPDQVPWKARSPATDGNHPLLERTGQMRKAIAVLGGANGGGLGVATGAGFKIGVKSINVIDGDGKAANTAVYGRTHQLGTKRVPKRRFIGIGRLDVKAVDSLMRREAAKLLRS